jgi:hypothetical protein
MRPSAKVSLPIIFLLTQRLRNGRLTADVGGTDEVNDSGNLCLTNDFEPIRGTSTRQNRLSSVARFQQNIWFQLMHAEIQYAICCILNTLKLILLEMAGVIVGKLQKPQQYFCVLRRVWLNSATAQAQRPHNGRRW